MKLSKPHPLRTCQAPKPQNNLQVTENKANKVAAI
jgi:hypothetical protein